MRRPSLLLFAVLLFASCSDTRKPAETTEAPQETGVLGQIQALASRLQQRRAQLSGRIIAPGSLPKASQSLNETYLALAAVQIEKTRDYLRLQLPEGEELAAETIKTARRLLDTRNPSGTPRLITHGPLVEHAYFADNDSSPQPYFVYMPSTYTKKKPLPLIILLHGWVPETSRIDPWLVTDDVVQLAEKHNAILAMPHGRTNTDFQYAGERDVLRVLAEMRRFYAVDADRVYLIGPSMGGAGVWQIGMHYPDLFAAIAPINAQGDWFRFWHEIFEYPTRKELPRFIQQLFAAHNPLDLAPNLSSLYSYSQHATLCFLGPAHTRDIVRRLAKLKIPHDFFEDPSELGHQIYFETDCWERAFEHVLKQRRAQNPKLIRYVTSSLRFPGSYWLHIQRFIKWRMPASFEAKVGGKGRIKVTTSNVASLTLTPLEAWADADGMFHVRWNGKSFKRQRPDASGRIRIDWSTESVDSKLVAKSQSVCGPASDVFNFAFVAVQGTTGTSEDKAASRSLTKQFTEAWYNYAEGSVPVVLDTDVTDEMMREKNLVLIGPAEANAVIMRIRDSLPFKISRDKIILPRGKGFHGQNMGLALTYPNPLAPDRYVLILQGILWGEHRSKNHRFDLLPDFAVFGSDSIPAININRFYAAGFFDEHWRYTPKLTDFWP